MKKRYLVWLALVVLTWTAAETVFAQDGCREALQGKWQLEPRGEEEVKMLQELGGQMFFEFDLTGQTMTVTLGEQTKTIKIAVKECTAERVVLSNAEEAAAGQPDLMIDIFRDGLIKLSGSDMTRNDRPTTLRKIN